jgi:hypothetical protein
MRYLENCLLLHRIVVIISGFGSYLVIFGQFLLEKNLHVKIFLFFSEELLYVTLQTRVFFSGYFFVGCNQGYPEPDPNAYLNNEEYYSFQYGVLVLYFCMMYKMWR